MKEDVSDDAQVLQRKLDSANLFNLDSGQYNGVYNYVRGKAQFYMNTKNALHTLNQMVNQMVSSQLAADVLISALVIG